MIQLSGRSGPDTTRFLSLAVRDDAKGNGFSTAISA
jgi:hypothetical protein